MYSNAINQHLNVDYDSDGTPSDEASEEGGSKFFKFDWKNNKLSMASAAAAAAAAAATPLSSLTHRHSAAISSANQPVSGSKPIKTPLPVLTEIDDEGPPISSAREKSFGSLGSDISTISSISSLSSDEE